jgi:hypothetical protein
MFNMPDRKMVQLSTELYDELSRWKRLLGVEQGRDLTYNDTIREAVAALKELRALRQP